ncbi:tetratricopeptide repeat protein [Phenylobacterium sp.]|uniref:O-linked N-acetylglucosamine transferase, SPINDLY family protein n=1 Tax=Phenylobacterium sp. TaxID=1871053 RepID=UPI0025E22D52|nr:tetratricopeptide repeat protein [Phenylobacterium sp.]MBX3482757.1 tetratricopeptide repeat protein [Phenylobacterium sp.]MCW5760376.1 tetratricopeptide repeat protein [Phenylobacterium sp.]
MSDRLQAAQAALNAGRRDEAIEHLLAAVAEDPARNAQVYRVLTANLYGAGRFEEGAAIGAQGARRHPKDYDLLNTYGVLLRKAKRQAEAVPILEAAIKLNPKNAAAQQNLGNVLLDLREGARAEAMFSKLVRIDPRNAEYQRQMGRALHQQARIEPALTRFRTAISLKKDNVDAWLDMVGALNEEFRTAEAEAALDKALAANPGDQRLLEGRALMYRRSGQMRRAEQFLTELLPANPDAAWLHCQIGLLVADWDREKANAHLRRAVELEPDRLDYAVALVESLERTRLGDEGGHIEEAYQLALTLLPRKGEFGDAATKIMTEVFVRVADYHSMDAVGDFKTLGRGWASTGRHTALLKQLARVQSDEDRLELIEQHRIWGRDVEKGAARRPIKRPPPRAGNGKIRLGFMSSDLRQHPVGYFAMPLFDHVDNERFEVFVYSYNLGKEDAAQQYITSRIAGYRWWPDISVGEAAEKIAADQLDILIELGGSTHMNKLEVMAYRPAPVQASWLGYPHSAGLDTIDYLVCDPYNVPERPELLVEKPLLLPKSWIALGARFFSNAIEIREELPQDRNGFVTYGTANNPHKYTSELLRAWARVVKATPNSRFAFIRPEGGSASFRANIEREFAHEGVGADRLVWHVVRGAHLPLYNEVDITLDTFPLTGGTTTTETLWMGVPVVSLVGAAFFERLSYSILNNAGLGDLCATSLDEFQAISLKLAADTERRRAIRRTIRDTLRMSPLGQTEQFAKDFYDMVHRALTERR